MGNIVPKLKDIIWILPVVTNKQIVVTPCWATTMGGHFILLPLVVVIRLIM